MEEQKEVKRSDLGIVTGILKGRGSFYKTEQWLSDRGDFTVYRAMDPHGQVVYLIKQYHSPKLDGGVEIKEWALKQKKFSDEICKHTKYFSRVLDVRSIQSKNEVDGLDNEGDKNLFVL